MNTATREAVRVHIRWAIRRDLPEVIDIEDRCFAWDAWTEEDFLRELRRRDTIGMVAEEREKVIGLMVYRLHKAKLEVINFAVHPSYHRRGVGSQMVAKLTSKLSSHSRTRITLQVRETNAAALAFFRRQGFLATAVLRGEYDDGAVDGVAMEYALPGAEDCPDEPFTCDEGE